MKRIPFNIYGLRLFLFTGFALASLSALGQNGQKKQFPVPENIPDTNRIGFPVMPNATDAGKNGGEYLTLKQCIEYAMIHQPALNKALISVTSCVS